MRQDTEFSHELVLIGGGHSHLAVIKQLAMHPVAGLRMSVISKDIHTPYSGMLPGLIAGHYEQDQCFIDLRKLCQWAGCRLFHSRATHIDSGQQQVHCDNRPPLRYDYLSINIGSTPHLADIAGSGDSGTAVKPIDRFMLSLDRWLAQLPHCSGEQCATVVGGGAASVELILSLRHRVLHMGGDAKVRFQLVSAEERLLPTYNRRVRAYFTGLLRNRSIDFKAGHRVEAIDGDRLLCRDRPPLHSDYTIWAVDAGAPAWLEISNIKLDDRGFVLVSDSLQSVSHPNIFAAGDCASMERQALPKSGVYAVRQGPVLADNLRRSALGKALRRYRPQRRFLSLLATGDKQAVASRGCWFAAGAWIWQWKSRIDTRFVRRFSPAPQAEADSGSGLPAAMRCGGCGAKVGSDALQDVLRRLDGNAAVDAGTTLDDAAIFTPPSGQQMVQTIDHFRAFIDDPYMIGRIGANHCLGDIYAMGATPDSALALANIPFSQGRIMADTLYQLMRGAADTLTEADTRLIGGHSSEAAELAFGLAVNGYIAPGQALLKSGLQVGQALVLSKPLGTGTLLAANMRHGARGRWIDDALASMQQSNGSAAAIIRQHRATACTDITGFGLLGHLLEMLHASGVAASLSIDSIPLLDGAMECLQQGYFSSLHADNSQQQRAIARVAKGAHGTRMEILYDPQTAGGLLAGIPPGQESLCVQALCAAGYHAAIIGQVQPLEHEPRIQCQ